MANYNTVLNDLLNQFPRYQFDRSVETLGGDRYIKKLRTWGQFTALLYAQASGKNSLREIENGLLLHSNRAYHLGLPEKVPHSTLADANKRRDWKIYQSLFYAMLDRCRDLTPTRKFKFRNPLYSLDSTIIELALSAFPWSRCSKRRGAIKLHYQFENASNLPVFMTVTEGARQDMVVAAEEVKLIPDSIYCFDKGFNDYAWFRRITDEGAYFVTRPRINMAASYLGQQERPQGKGILADFMIEMSAYRGRMDYPYPLRLIAFYDRETGRYLEFLTNNFTLAAATIAAIYKARWQVEIFFKWIKQNLKIKSFLGTSKNAVLTQVWVAMCYYLVLAYVKYQSRYKGSLFYFHRVVKEALLEHATILDLLRLNHARLQRLIHQEPQLCLQL